MNTGIYISSSTTSVSGLIKNPIALTPTGAFLHPSHDLVSRGKNTSGSNQCYGDYDSSTGTGSGPGYSNSCIHSGTIANIDVNTVWYSYTLASAGTITGTSNTNTVTQSICPKGWALPSQTQIDSQRDISSFSLVLGGRYYNSTLGDESTAGYWWSSTAYNGALRYYLRYDGSSLYNYYGRRYYGVYVRCVQAS